MEANSCACLVSTSMSTTLTHHLTCIDDSNTDPGATPKITRVAGVTFHRSKHGNLYRAGLVKKSMRYRMKCQEFWVKQLLIDRVMTGKTTSKRARNCVQDLLLRVPHPPTAIQAGPRTTDLNESNHLSISVGRPYTFLLTFSYRYVRTRQSLPLHARSEQDRRLQGLPSIWSMRCR